MGWFDWLKSEPADNTTAKVTEPRPLNVGEFAEENDDLIKSWQLYVTMSPDTPLEWLKRHGERAKKPHDVPENFAIWLPDTNSFKELDFGVSKFPESTMASDFGQIPENGGEFLNFLMAYRSVVETNIPDTERLTALTSLNAEHPTIVEKLGGDLVEFFCLKELQSTFSCGRGVASKLFYDGLRTPSQVREASLERILSIEGIGKVTAVKLLS